MADRGGYLCSADFLRCILFTISSDNTIIMNELHSYFSTVEELCVEKLQECEPILIFRYAYLNAMRTSLSIP